MVGTCGFPYFKVLTFAACLTLVMRNFYFLWMVLLSPVMVANCLGLTSPWHKSSKLQHNHDPKQAYNAMYTPMIHFQECAVHEFVFATLY